MDELIKRLASYYESQISLMDWQCDIAEKYTREYEELPDEEKYDFLLKIKKEILSTKQYQFKYIGEEYIKSNNGYAEEGFVIADGVKKYKEYDGSKVMSTNEVEAWSIFLNYSGKFGLPDERNYEIIHIVDND